MSKSCLSSPSVPSCGNQYPAASVPASLPPPSLESPKRFYVTPGSVPSVRGVLLHRLHLAELARRDRLAAAFRAVEVPIPSSLCSPISKQEPSLIPDTALIRSLSKLITITGLSLKDTVALWRNESQLDTRPNKALDPEWLDILLHDYPFRERVVDAARYGVDHILQSPRTPDTIPVQNHKTAKKYPAALLRSIAEGQAAGTYLVITMNTALAWTELRFSPFGCVPKKDADPTVEARLIHDLSCPADLSTNACSVQDDLPELLFVPVRRLAQRVEELATLHPAVPTKILKGDVKWAFRNIPIASRLAAHFAGSSGRDEAVVDLALPFGWTGSPAHYGTFGEAISFMVARESPHTLDPSIADNEPFFSYVWVDDHVLIEPDRGSRLALAETALRLSMLAALGPNAINDKKFSSWSSELVALGLTWNTAKRTVSMPKDKITKALSRIDETLAMKYLRKHQLEKLLGSLRHVGLCCRASRAFIQRLHHTWMTASKFTKISLPTAVQEDLKWIRALLENGAMNSIPTSVIAGTIPVDVNLFMDASNEGLCVLYPAAKEFFRVHFDDDELHAIKDENTVQPFSINVRETLSAVFAVLIWGPRWSHVADNEHRTVHIRCWIDNTSAVSWISHHSSNNPHGQELMRVLSCAESQFRLHISTSHLEGSSNYLADLGSRAWSGTQLKTWTNTVSCWHEQTIPTSIRKIYKAESLNFNGDRLQTHPENYTSGHGINGAASVYASVSPPGSTNAPTKNNRYNSLCLLLNAGKEATTPPRGDLTPYGRSCAILAGVINSSQASDHDCSRNTTSYCRECVASARHVSNEVPSRSQCSRPSSTQPPFPAPSTASFVGLRCWASTFVCEGRSTCPFGQRNMDTA